MKEDIILVYGSYAKNESNEFSDIDVLIVTENHKMNSVPKDLLKEFNLDTNKIDVKVMHLASFKKLVKINSLYIHHLKECNMFLKGKTEFERLTSSLGEYEIRADQIKKLVELANDCLESIRCNGINIYDLSILFTFLRNAIIFINYKFGVLEFNKLKAIELYENQPTNHPSIKNIYILCYNAKLKFQRGYYTGPIISKWNQAMEKEIIDFILYFLEGTWL